MMNYLTTCTTASMMIIIFMIGYIDLISRKVEQATIVTVLLYIEMIERLKEGRFIYHGSVNYAKYQLLVAFLVTNLNYP